MAKINQGLIIKALNFGYEQALDPNLPGVDSSYDMADDYTSGDESLIDQVNCLIRWQNAKSATSGFVSGMGGLVTMPVTLPANITHVLFTQVRMIAAIAIMGGYDPRDDKVQTLTYVCMAGNSGKEILKKAGIRLGTKLTEKLIAKLSFEVIKSINKAVGFRLVTKFGEKGLVNLGKAVPFVGGVIGGTFDGVSTNIVGNVARDTFIAA